MIENLIYAFCGQSEKLKIGRGSLKFVTIVETFGEAGPQVILQLYILSLNEWTDDDSILGK